MLRLTGVQQSEISRPESFSNQEIYVYSDSKKAHKVHLDEDCPLISMADPSRLWVVAERQKVLVLVVRAPCLAGNFGNFSPILI